MGRTVRGVLVGVVAVAVVAAVVLWRVGESRGGEEQSRSAVARRGAMVITVSGSGTIQPNRRASLSFGSPGRVQDVLVDVGDVVSAGDVLARLDSRQLALRVQQSEAGVELVQAQLDQLTAPPLPEAVEQRTASVRAAESQVAAASASLDQALKGASDAQIAGAKAQVVAAELQKKIAQDAYDKTVRSTDDADRIESANYDLYVAKEELRASQAQLDQLLAGTDTDDIRAARDNVRAAEAQRDAAQAQLDLLTAGPTDEQVANAEAKVSQAEAGLESAKIALENAELTAPFDGVVSAVNILPNELSPGRLPPIELLDVSRYQLTVRADEVDVGQLASGMPVEVTVEALPDVTIGGTVDRVATVATLAGGVVYYDVTVTLGPTDAPIRADMTADALITVSELDDVLMIPTWTVRVNRTTGQTYVERRVANDVSQVDVSLGVRSEGWVQVLAGLSEGDEVVLGTSQDIGPFGSGGE